MFSMRLKSFCRLLSESFLEGGDLSFNEDGKSLHTVAHLFLIFDTKQVCFAHVSRKQIERYLCPLSVNGARFYFDHFLWLKPLAKELTRNEHQKTDATACRHLEILLIGWIQTARRLSFFQALTG